MKSLKYIIIATFFTLIAQAQNNNYSKLWNKVEAFELDGLPKSALKEVKTIEALAKKDVNETQLIKTLLFKSKFALILEENAQLTVINDFKLALTKAKAPHKNILENTLANLYWQYYQQNRYKFYNRTKTSAKVDTNDFRTWDLETLFIEIKTHFQNSLKNGLLLQETNLNDFEALLVKGKDANIYRPTLFDILSHNALSFYKTTENSITKPTEVFSIHNLDYLSSSKDFIKISLSTKDPLSIQFETLKTYKELINFHSRKENALALAHVNIERLTFVNQYAQLTNKQDILLKTFQEEASSVKKNEALALYNFEIASIYYNQGSSYSPEKKTTVQFKLKEALDLCEATIKLASKSLGVEKCTKLKRNILRSTLQITTESNLLINQKQKLLVTYKNTNKVSFKAFKISHKQLKAYSKFHRNTNQKKFISKLNASKNWENDLVNEHDYQLHRIELSVPELENGLYIIEAKTDKEAWASTTIQVTNIAIVDTDDASNKYLQVINRTNGKPIHKANIELKFTYRDKEFKTEHFKTDVNGFVSFSLSKHNRSNYTTKVKTNSETAYFGNSYINHYERHENKKRTVYQSFLFTDRSIYRPGQTVYFKNIALKTVLNKSEVLPKEKVKATLYNVNNEEVRQLDLVTNAYGSVSGEFILPNTGLNGYYHIKTEYNNPNLNTSISFSVEEYKRPKFETTFKPTTETYKINDSITVKGNALAFSGSNISDAKVVYKVKRTVSYSNFYRWNRPYFNSRAQEITFGETKTNDIGEFEITFKALADESANKDNLPIFTYEISADVTDINGETRSESTTIKVGYHALLATISAPQKLDKSNKKQQISINTTNLNSEFTPSKGIINIYKLTAPTHVLRTRPWQAPDYKSLSQKDFKLLFPNEAYDNESVISNWKKGELVFSKPFNTATEKQVALGHIKRWESGVYKIELEAKDKFGQLVKNATQTSVYSKKDKSLADKQLFDISLDKDTYKPNDVAELTFASAADVLDVTLMIEKDRKLIDIQIHNLKNNKKSISIPINDTDLGGFSIHYSFSFANSFKSGTLNINVPYPKAQLDIETLTFRDKLQPGTPETWQFKIKGDNNEKASAELLASMYDASLDEIKTHQWNFNVYQPNKYNSYRSPKSRYSFGVTNFRVHQKHHNYYNQTNLSFDHLNWFGLHFGNNRYYNTYLRRISKNYKTGFNSALPKGEIRGVIYYEKNLPLPGATLFIENTKKGTSANIKGVYNIKASVGQTITANFVGYSSQSYKIEKGVNTIDFYLFPNDSRLDEVVITSRGIERNTAPLNSEVLAEEEAYLRDDFNYYRGNVYVKNALNEDGTVKVITTNDIVYDTLPNGKIIARDLPLRAKLTTSDDIENPEYYFLIRNGKKIKIAKQNFTTAKIRKNLQETAFFFPKLTTDKDGNISFNFTTPEALTKWNLNVLAHNKKGEFAQKQLQTVTQKELMVVPNAPRFLREGDVITISSKIANISDKDLNGQAVLQLFDALTGKEIDAELKNTNNTKAFTVIAKNNTQVSWELTIPETVQAVQYKVIAKTDSFSDGEQNVLPVLSNRMLVTESLPMTVKTGETRTFTLDKLKTTTSKTLKHHKLTLEITSNPAWYAVQALPYLMEYPYECNEQTFSRYYANALATHIANSNPKIQAVFNQWKNTDTLLSNLEKNQELKSILIEETPWLRDAQSEAEQKKRIALLFDLNKMKQELERSTIKLKNNQMASGAWSWFGDYRANRYITQHIITGFGHLKQLNVSLSAVETSKKADDDTKDMIRKAISYLDQEFVKEYKDLKKYPKVNLSQNHLTATQLHYLYMRSFFPKVKKSKEVETITDYYLGQIKSYWLKQSLYQKGMMSLISFRNNDTKTATKILKSLKENSITNDELGMYWKSNTNSFYWYQAPIETQALMIEAFSEINADTNSIDQLKIWLLKNKQTNQWKTTKATTDAIYALLLQGSDWLSVNESVSVLIDNKPIAKDKLDQVKTEAGTGYYKTSWNAQEITSDLAKVTLSKKEKGIAYGALYWQYFEDLDQITPAKTPLQLSKKLFLKKNTKTGEVITEINSKTELKVGDLIRVRIELRTDRTMEFVHLKDMRASGLEPVNVISTYKYQDNLGYYESTKDASTNFFMDVLPKGIYVFEYDLRVNNAGNMSNGISTIQSMYAPEFSSHSEGVRVSSKQ